MRPGFIGSGDGRAYCSRWRVALLSPDDPVAHDRGLVHTGGDLVIPDPKRVVRGGVTSDAAASVRAVLHRGEREREYRTVLASETIRGLPAWLDWMVLFDLSTLRRLVPDEAVRGMFCLPESTVSIFIATSS
jgi:hypothetical protein